MTKKSRQKFKNIENEQSFKGTLMQIWKSANVSVFMWKNMLKVSH